MKMTFPSSLQLLLSLCLAIPVSEAGPGAVCHPYSTCEGPSCVPPTPAGSCWDCSKSTTSVVTHGHQDSKKLLYQKGTPQIHHVGTALDPKSAQNKSRQVAEIYLQNAIRRNRPDTLHGHGGEKAAQVPLPPAIHLYVERFPGMGQHQGEAADEM